MLDDAIATQLRTHLQKVVQPIVLRASLDDGAKSAELAALLDEIAAMSELITVERTDDDERRPSFAIVRAGTDVSVRFAGIPLGHEFTSLVLALLQVGGHPSTARDETVRAVEALTDDLHFETYFSLSCQNCPDVVQALNLMSVLNPRVSHTAIDGALFADEVESRQVMAVPAVFLNGEPWGQGRMTLEEIVDRLDSGAAERRAEELADRDVFDVLVVGGGPAGAAAAIYSARKGISTGVVAERFGGQVLDTLAIENFISVPYTEGPKLAAAMEQHVLDHDVDVMDLQRAARLIPGSDGDPIGVELDNGVVLRSRSVVISTGARWRTMDVPGEAEYRNKGVAYCPHCDGPLFKGKRVAVVGGGNSGVEAAIDLAGIVSHVTLIEFDDQLRADDVLQRKLRSLPNVDVLVSSLTTEVHGDGSTVTGITVRDRVEGSDRLIELDGVFVQIGLLPNTEWLEGAVELSPRREVVIDDHGRTSVPGVFAAGDCTTVPFKQIVIAMGAGATASLSAFDHLIRTGAPAEDGSPTTAPAAAAAADLAAAPS
ncbi:MAG TPA: alkyl hydroperoxide reductase subunit F [Microthrixaceae bacterium]|nr:alkyl hydroperoxide reductase subunit F [Microthrixaceae bacterium]MCB9401778.1 alkyl hydroperoxide reductase subunit F [Microthrixaceae bacterium]MCO5306142.1 alkyl hydroperoxide reductase subunit F [Microthrixaceae bacterium]HPG14316.1 alkyl hydroperoxide reductase subunit F [Microthrixaceae bacterium]HRW40272.1 alkyl hydroperoxide reductase subunit F [Microthrixaceae bacterium]